MKNGFLPRVLCAALCLFLWVGPAERAAAEAGPPDAAPGIDRKLNPGLDLPGLDLPGLDFPGRAGARREAPPGPVFRTPHVTAELLSEQAGLQPGTTAWVALRFAIAPNWHTYWRNAGDSGAATRIDWDLPAGYAAGGIVWLPPERIRVGPLVNYGYSGEAIHMVPITVPEDARPGAAAVLGARASWLVCEDICIPEEGVLQLRLPVLAGPPAANTRAAATFARARAAMPQPAPWPAHFRFDGDSFRLEVAAAGLDRAAIADAWFYPYRHGVVTYAAAQALTATGRGFSLATQRGPAAGSVAGPVAEVGGLLVLKQRRAGGGVATAAYRLSAVEAAAPAAGAPLIGFWEAVALALLGGLILNLMPCVLPVLAVKALGLARHARSGDGQGRAGGRAGGMARHGWAYTAGVLASFAAIGAVLLALRSAGAAAGWGFQLQEPVFVLLMAWLMVLIGLNFAGLFEIGGRFAGIGSGLAARPGLAGSFFTGVLAVVVATPCTAPYMGAAVGFALAQDAAVAMAVMLALGLGLALPFLLLGMAPGLVRLIPPPGPWMVRFRQFLAFPMFATAAWLVWVLTLQAGDAALLAALAGAILIAFAVWLWQASAGAARLWRPLGLGLALAAAAAALATLRYADNAAPPAAAPAAAATATGPVWEPFSEARLAALRAQGRPVFVNFTAAWCITCLANERVVLRRDSVVRAVAEAGMALLKADWTRRDPVIARHLAAFGRSGVPLYVLYPPQDAPGQPHILPQILTEAGTVAAIRSMAARARSDAASDPGSDRARR